MTFEVLLQQVDTFAIPNMIFRQKIRFNPEHRRSSRLRHQGARGYDMLMVHAVLSITVTIESGRTFHDLIGILRQPS